MGVFVLGHSLLSVAVLVVVGASDVALPHCCWWVSFILGCSSLSAAILVVGASDMACHVSIGGCVLWW